MTDTHPLARNRRRRIAAAFGGAFLMVSFFSGCGSEEASSAGDASTSASSASSTSADTGQNPSGGAAPDASAAPESRAPDPATLEVGEEFHAPEGFTPPPVVSEAPASLEQGRYAPYGLAEDGQPRVPADAPRDEQCSIIKGTQCNPKDVQAFEEMCTDNPLMCATYFTEDRSGLAK